MSKLCVKRSWDITDNAQLSRFSLADIKCRHFLVFLFSICSIQHTCHIWSEMSLQIRFYFPTNYNKIYKLFYRFFPTILGFISCTNCKPGYFSQNGEQISFFWGFFCLDFLGIFAVFKAQYLAPLLILKRGKVSSFK